MPLIRILFPEKYLLSVVILLMTSVFVAHCLFGCGERGGEVGERQTPNREVLGSIPTSVGVVSLSKTH